jgi:hypothetical protein
MNRFSELTATLYQPMLAPLAAQRKWVFGLAAIGAVQVGLSLAHLPGWICPFRAITGLPCPGCFMTTSIDELFRGQVGAAFRTHAFAPLFLLAYLVVLGVALLPGSLYQRALAWLEASERRTGVMGWMLIGLMLYWVIRLAGFV